MSGKQNHLQKRNSTIFPCPEPPSLAPSRVRWAHNVLQCSEKTLGKHSHLCFSDEKMGSELSTYQTFQQIISSRLSQDLPTFFPSEAPFQLFPAQSHNKPTLWALRKNAPVLKGKLWETAGERRRHVMFRAWQGTRMRESLNSDIRMWSSRSARLLLQGWGPRGWTGSPEGSWMILYAFLFTFVLHSRGDMKLWDEKWVWFHFRKENVRAVWGLDWR